MLFLSFSLSFVFQDAYTTRDIILNVSEAEMEVEKDLEIPRFRLTKYYTENTLVNYSTGKLILMLSIYCVSQNEVIKIIFFR